MQTNIFKRRRNIVESVVVKVPRSEYLKGYIKRKTKRKNKIINIIRFEASNTEQKKNKRKMV